MLELTVKRRQRGKEGGHKIGKTGQRHLWMAPKNKNQGMNEAAFFTIGQNLKSALKRIRPLAKNQILKSFYFGQMI